MAQRKDFYSWFQSETSSRGFETQWASAGAAVGVWFGGVGAVPGAIIGGFVGGLVGGYLFTERINPANLIHKLPFQRKRYEELGIDIHQEINKAWGDKRFGLSTVAAGGFLWGGLALFFFSVLMMLKVSISTLLIIGCGVGSGLICYVFVFKQDKYINYFDRFEKWSKQDSANMAG